MEKVRVGAVVYDPRVPIIWEMIEQYFADRGLPTEAVYYKTYKLQVDGLIDNEIDIAWNSPLAWVDAFLRTDGKALNGAMRDTDQNRKTMLVVRSADGIQTIQDLKGKKIGFGAIDSPQARLIPINFLHNQGLKFGRDYEEVRFDVGVGLHGDHVGGELDAMKALQRGEVDASFTLDLNWSAWGKDGTVDKNQLEVLSETPHFDHCIFSGRVGFDEALFNRWMEILEQMDYGQPDQQKIMDLEGLKRWVPGRTSGYEQILAATNYMKFFD